MLVSDRGIPDEVNTAPPAEVATLAAPNGEEKKSLAFYEARVPKRPVRSCRKVRKGNSAFETHRKSRDLHASLGLWAADIADLPVVEVENGSKVCVSHMPARPPQFPRGAA